MIGERIGHLRDLTTATAVRQRRKARLIASQNVRIVVMMRSCVWNRTFSVFLPPRKIRTCVEKGSCVVRRRRRNLEQVICWGVAGNGNRRSFPACSCAGLTVQRIQVRPQLMARNARNPLHAQHAKRRNLIPLRYSLRSDANQAGKLGLPSDTFDRALQCFFSVAHDCQLKHGFT